MADGDVLTPVLSLTKPAWDGPADIRVFSANMDKIDADAGATDAALDALNPMTALGDLIVGGSSGVPGRLGVGTDGRVLGVVAGAPVWVPPTPMTAPGDLVVGGTSGAPARLGAGAAGEVLTTVAGAPAWSSVTTAAPAIPVSLLVNGSLDVWARGNGPFTTNGAYTADRWQLNLGAGSTVSVTRDSANAAVGSVSCAALVYTHAAVTYLNQSLREDYQQLRGRTVTATVQVKTTAANAVRVRLNDGVGTADGAFHSGSGAYETLTVTRAVDPAATTLVVQVTLAASCTAYLDNAVLVVGATAPLYAPLAASDELARCKRYYEVLGSGVVDEPFGLGQDRSVAEIRWPLFYAEKAVAPTVTVSAPNHFGAWLLDFSGATAFQTLAAQNAGLTSCLMVGTATFTGHAGGNASLITSFNTAARIRIEANPT